MGAEGGGGGVDGPWPGAELASGPPLSPPPPPPPLPPTKKEKKKKAQQVEASLTKPKVHG